MKRAPLGGLIAGTVVTQVVNSALHLIEPLLVAQLSGSLALAAFVAAAETGVHMLGSLAGGRPTDRLGARNVLAASTALRGAALAGVPLAWALGHLTLGWVLAAYTLDAFVRGFTDTAVHAVPLTLGAHDRAALDRINSRYEFAFDAGGIAGPLLFGGLAKWGGPALSHGVVAAGFGLAAAAFLAIPNGAPALARGALDPHSAGEGSGGALEGFKLVWKNADLRWACLGLAAIHLYPLRKLTSAFFAKAILKNPPAAAWVGAAFGLGGALGALAYGWLGDGAGERWLAAGGLGLAFLAFGWAPASLAVMCAAAFVFAVTNAGARLVLTRRLQLATPDRAIGGVTAVARLASNASSTTLKSALGLAFAAGAGPSGAFSLVGAGLGLLALAHAPLVLRERREAAAAPVPAEREPVLA